MPNYRVIENLESEVTKLVSGIYGGFRNAYRAGMRKPTRMQLVEHCAPWCDGVYAPGVILARLPLETFYVNYASDNNSSKMRLLELTICVALEWMNLRAHILVVNPMAATLYRNLFRMRLFQDMTQQTSGRFVKLLAPIIVVECLKLTETIGAIGFRESLERRINEAGIQLALVADSN